MGVDVFFVISGYLITSIILKDHEMKVFTIKKFWLRRLRRVFPALVVLVIAMTVVGYFTAIRSDLNDLGLHGISAILAIANLCFWRTPGGYWGATAENSYFLHTWSLSVEEQFYLGYPFVMLILLRFARERVLITILAIAACSFLLYLYGSKYHAAATFFLLPMRAWELATGCTVAVMKWKKEIEYPKSIVAALSLLGLTAIILSYHFISNENRYLGYLIAPVVGSALILYFSDSKTSILHRMLSLSPFIFIGKISYSLYLWHWPLLVVAKHSTFIEDSIYADFVVLCMIFLISVVSYKYVEQPMRYREKIIKPAILGLIVSLSLSSVLYAAPFPPHDYTFFDASTYKGQLYNVNPINTWSETTRRRMKGTDAPHRDKLQNNAYATGGIIHKYGGEKPEIVVLGDSHALMWSGVIDEVCRELGITVSFYGADDTLPFVKLPLTRSVGNSYFTAEEKYVFENKKLNCIAEWKPKIVIIAVKWSIVRDINMTDDLVQYIGNIGCKIILFEQPPELFFGDRNALEYLSFIGLKPKENLRQYVRSGNRKRYETGRSIIQKISDKYSYVSVLHVKDIYYQEGSGVWAIDGSQVLYIDDDHLNHEGTLRMKSRIVEGIGYMLRS